MALYAVTIPCSVSEALKEPKWKTAMTKEMMALEKNNMWDLVELHRGRKLVGCKWVFIIKYRSVGSVDRYKARLVVKRYTQTFGIDYQETFAPVAKMNLTLQQTRVGLSYNLMRRMRFCMET